MNISIVFSNFSSPHRAGTLLAAEAIHGIMEGTIGAVGLQDILGFDVQKEAPDIGLYGGGNMDVAQLRQSKGMELLEQAKANEGELLVWLIHAGNGNSKLFETLRSNSIDTNRIFVNIGSSELFEDVASEEQVCLNSYWRRIWDNDVERTDTELDACAIHIALISIAMALREKSEKFIEIINEDSVLGREDLQSYLINNRLNS